MWGKSMEWGPNLGRVLGKKENKKPVTAPEVGSGQCTGGRAQSAGEDSPAAAFLASSSAQARGTFPSPFIAFLRSLFSVLTAHMSATL